MRFPVIVAAAIALTGFVALVSRRLRQILSLRFQQLVQRFFYTAAHKFSNLTFDSFLVQCYSFLRHGSQAPFRMCSVAVSFYHRL